MSATKERIRYADLFWLFLAGSLLGVLIEGVFCVFHYGHWETHTVTMWGPFCIIYGLGAVGLYVGARLMRNKGWLFQFAVYALVSTAIEYLCGMLLKYGLHMRAWDYRQSFLNIDGLICPAMTLVWGAAGVVFSKLLMPPLERLFHKMDGKGWKGLCAILSVLMAVNLSVTFACIVRWSARHQGIPPQNPVQHLIDLNADDAMMQRRFCEWRFEDKAQKGAFHERD